MMSAKLEAYLSRLQRELEKEGLADAGILDEVREHLIDAVASGLRRGLSADAAEQEALVRFGSVELVAADFANERPHMSQRLEIVLSRIARIVGRFRAAPTTPLHYHDVGPSRYHFALRVKRRYRGVSAIEADPRERLARFLEEFGRRTFGSAGTLESLTPLEGGKYLAAFGSGSRMIWTVALSADGGVSFDGTNAAA